VTAAYPLLHHLYAGHMKKFRELKFFFHGILFLHGLMKANFRKESDYKWLIFWSGPGTFFAAKPNSLRPQLKVIQDETLDGRGAGQGKHEMVRRRGFRRHGNRYLPPLPHAVTPPDRFPARQFHG